jgi:hypothetical protein
VRRLEYVRNIRSAPAIQDSSEPALYLAKIVRERRRLEQERHTLLQRIGRIDARLGSIDASETRIVPLIQAKAQLTVAEAAVRQVVEARQVAVPPGCGEFTLHY